MYYTGNVSEQCEDNVEEEVCAAATLDCNCCGWGQDGDNNEADITAHFENRLLWYLKSASVGHDFDCKVTRGKSDLLEYTSVNSVMQPVHGDHLKRQGCRVSG
jgi:hypothetical protein